MIRDWQNFYVIVGAAGSTLIGIQFVVMTLVATMRRHQTSSETIGAFGTPTVVHFAMALFIAAAMNVPWPSLLLASLTMAVSAVAAFGYSIVVVRRAHRQTTYETVQEDWLWYAILPCSAYATLTVAAFLLRSFTAVAAFLIAASAVALLLIGIHNAWDTVTYIVVARHEHDEKREE